MELMKMQRYESYKDSGVDWIGEIPKHWNSTRLKRTVDGCVNGLWGGEPNEKDSVIVLRVADFDRKTLTITDEKLTLRSIPTKELKGRLLKRGDLLIEKSGGGDKTLVGCVVIFDKPYRAVTSNFVAKMAPREGFSSSYLNYVFSCFYENKINFRSIKQTTGIQNLDSSAYLSEIFFFPTIQEQTAIANFLDQKTTQIDEAIAIKEQQIELLKERKQIIIQKAVTQGLNPNVPMKDSGVEWIGKVPEHWRILANRVLFTERVEVGSEGLPLLSVSIHSGVSSEEISEEENIRGRVKIEDKTKYILVKPGDIAFNMMRAWQGGIGAVSTEGMVSPAYIVAKAKPIINADYFEFQYRCPEFIQQMDRFSKGITDFRKRLYWDSFKQLNTVVPPIDEQQEIIVYIKNETEKTEKTAALLNQQIEKLKEYKATLINSAVTGKIRVVAND